MTEVSRGGGPAKEPTRLCLRKDEGRNEPEDVEERRVQVQVRVAAGREAQVSCLQSSAQTLSECCANADRLWEPTT